MTSLVLAAFAAALATTAVQAQSSRADSVKRDSAATDSVGARLARVEEEITLLRRQLGDEARGGTHTRSRIGLTLTARIQMNLFAGSNRTNSVDVPQVVLAPTTPVNISDSPGSRTFGMSLSSVA
jgi:hypothetical protein